MYKSINISKEWASTVTFTEFKKNAIVAKLEPKEQKKLYEDTTGKKVKAKKSDN